MSELETAVRTIESILPEMPTKGLQKWKAILETALIKIETELATTQMHKCGVCEFEEYGYRTELPTAWRERGDLLICFHHEDSEVAEQISTALTKDAKSQEVEAEQTLDDLMAIL